MKKIILGLFLTIGLVSCNNDDASSDDGSTAAIEGKWAYSKVGAIVGGQEVLTDYPHECATKKDYIELVAGGNANDVYYPSDCVADIVAGAWSKSGNNVSITFDGITEAAEIITLNTTTLKVKYDDEGTTRVSVYTRQ